MTKKQGIPPWAWVGCGCLLFPLLIAAVAAAFGFFAFNFGKSAIEKMADPEKRAAAARDTLGATALPEGWHVRTYFSFPFGFALVTLADGTPPKAPEGESFEEKARSLENLDLRDLGDNRRVFLYLETDSANDNSIEEIINGSRRSNGMNLNLGIRFQHEKDLARGDLQVRGQRVAFQAKKGLLRHRASADEPVVYTELSFECKDKPRRLGLLFERLPAPAQSGPEALEATEERAFEVAGTPADVAMLQSFLDHFAVCH